jgi:hypothetical protein
MRDNPDWSMAQISRHIGWVNEAGEPLKTRVQSAIRRLAEDKLVTQTRHGAPWTVTEKGKMALIKPEATADPTPPPKTADPEPASPPTEAEITAELERIRDLPDAAFLALGREALAVRLNCKPHQVAGLRTRAQAGKAKAEAAAAKAALTAARKPAK